MELFQADSLLFWVKSISAPILTYNQVICCTTCNTELQQEIFNSSFFPTLFKMLFAFILLSVMVAFLTYYSSKNCKTGRHANPSYDVLNPVPLTIASVVQGIGIGGFFDGIVFHQIFQWHSMLSNVLPPSTLMSKSVNMFWDGIFHFFTLSVVIVGMVLFWRLLRLKNIDTSINLFIGGLLVGWGLFNMVEGVINHQILKLHNVMEFSPDHDIANYTFLGISMVMLVSGYFIIKKG